MEHTEEFKSPVNIEIEMYNTNLLVHNVSKVLIENVERKWRRFTLYNNKGEPILSINEEADHSNVGLKIK